MIGGKHEKQSLLLLGAFFLAFLLVAGNASAASYSYWQFSFTGEDLMNNVFVEGEDDSSAADNDLYDGARLLRVGANPNHEDAARTFVESEHQTFNKRWADLHEEGYTFSYFNLWGLDGRGENWGEDYKPYQWISHEADGWHTYYQNWDDAGYGTPPPDFHTLDFPAWLAETDGDSLDMENPASTEFSFTLQFKNDDMWWGLDTKGLGTEDAPNELPEMTIWFGGWLANDYDWDTGHMYEGNISFTFDEMTPNLGAQVPEPTTWLLFGTGLLGLLAIGRKRFFNRGKA